MATVRPVVASSAWRIAPMPPSATAADFVLSLAEKFLRQGPAHGGGLRRERKIAVIPLPEAMHFHDGYADLDFLIRPEPHALHHPPAIDEDAVRAPEILDQELIEIDREVRVPRRDPVAFHHDVRILSTSIT